MKLLIDQKVVPLLLHALLLSPTHVGRDRAFVRAVWLCTPCTVSHFAYLPILVLVAVDCFVLKLFLNRVTQHFTEKGSWLTTTSLYPLVSTCVFPKGALPKQPEP